MIRKRWWVTSRDRQFIYRLHKKDKEQLKNILESGVTAESY